MTETQRNKVTLEYEIKNRIDKNLTSNIIELLFRRGLSSLGLHVLLYNLLLFHILSFQTTEFKNNSPMNNNRK